MLHRPSLSVRPGEFPGLLGPSGRGKTTALRPAGGVTAVSAGRILFDGAEITRLPPGRRPLATVFRDHALVPHMTVEGNVRLAPRVRRRSGPAAPRLVAGMPEIVGLAELRRRFPGPVSGGRKRRARR